MFSAILPLVVESRLPLALRLAALRTCAATIAAAAGLTAPAARTSAPVKGPGQAESTPNICRDMLKQAWRYLSLRVSERRVAEAMWQAMIWQAEALHTESCAHGVDECPLLPNPCKD